MDGIKELIQNNYKIEVYEIEKIKNAFRIKTDNEYMCFKSSNYDIDQFRFIVSAIDYLYKRGFEGVLPPIKTKNGENFIKVNEGYGYLCKWIDSREADFKNPVELKMCVNTLSNLHIASMGFKIDFYIKNRNYYGKWIKRFKKRCDELLYFKALIKSKDKLSDFDNIYLKYFDSHYRQGLKAIKDLEESKYFEIMERHKELSYLCHHDTANHNFLITSNLDMYMIDFDYCILDTNLHDLSSIIIRNLKYGNWDFEILDFILSVYYEKIPISNDEIYLIFCFMQFPQDFWQVGLQYYVEKQPWEEEFFLRKLKRIVEDSKERMSFLREFEQRLKEGQYGDFS
ncbi:CotS family spore coat protein [Caloramator sp. E03]|uniref:CotS family spore coat protein n=1 Tax=Caloramator sp. E03 TaxID=2576307 RepID=UPI0011102235|nr:CotS family spore coat protein [Caloramator sp. E03]QCX33434.1 CotS family spore coat protein [Caloramator sp. E03]